MRQSYRDLQVWQKGMDLVVRIYELTSLFPQNEMYGLTSQMRRAAVSVPSNLAEGKGRSDRDFSRFVLQSRGSVWELETQVEIAGRLGYLPDQHVQEIKRQTSEISRMLNGMLEALADRAPASHH